MTALPMRVALGVLLSAIAVTAQPFEPAADRLLPLVAPGDDLAIIVHRSNPVDALTFAELRRIFSLETQTWPHGRRITLVLREKDEPERAEAIRLVLGMSAPDYERHVLFQTFRGRVGLGPRSIRSAAAMVRFVFNAPGAIGYVGADQVDASVKVLKIDGLVPNQPEYPLQFRR